MQLPDLSNRREHMRSLDTPASTRRNAHRRHSLSYEQAPACYLCESAPILAWSPENVTRSQHPGDAGDSLECAAALIHSHGPAARARSEPQVASGTYSV